MASKEKNKKSFTLLPRQTEKATAGETRGVYTFILNGPANKKTLAARIRQDFKVSPRKIHVVKLPSKTAVFRGRSAGRRGGAIKALVYLKSGDKITVPSPTKK